ncbi:MAG: hypothetical protein ABJA34_13185 [Pseudonocardiales bacterium]
MMVRLLSRCAVAALSFGAAVVCLPGSPAVATQVPVAAATPDPSPASLLTLPLPLPSLLPPLDPTLQGLPLPVPLPSIDPLLQSLVNLTPVLAPPAPLLSPPPAAGSPTLVPLPPLPGAASRAPGGPGAPTTAGGATAAKALSAATAGDGRAAAGAATPQQQAGTKMRASAAAGHSPRVRSGVIASVVADRRSIALLLLLFGVLAGFLLVQRLIDRRDPKLSQSPAWPEPDVAFG